MVASTTQPRGSPMRALLILLLSGLLILAAGVPIFTAYAGDQHGKQGEHDNDDGNNGNCHHGGDNGDHDDGDDDDDDDDNGGSAGGSCVMARCDVLDEI